MKNIILLMALFIVQQGLYGQSDSRDVLAVQGAPGNSYNWHSNLDLMENDGYNFRRAFSLSDFNSGLTIGENVATLDDGVDLPIHNYTNVLGLGHDTGGLAIRGLKVQNNKITGQILVGTPNQGSRFLLGLHSSGDGNGNTDLENFVTNMEDWLGGIVCPSCNKTTRLKQYITGMKNQPYSYGAIYDPNSYYALLPEVDHNTTAVIWGDAGDQTLGHFLGSNGGPLPGDNVDLQECLDRLIAEKEAALELDKELLIVSKVSSYFSNYLKVIGGIVSAKGDIGKILAKGGEYIERASDTFIKEIRAQEKLDKEFKELLICSLANQRLEAQWRAYVVGGEDNVVSTFVESPDFDEELCNYWSYQCQYNSYHPDHNTFCENQVMYCGQNVYQLVFVENDFVYSKTEQQIPNLSRTFKIDANHFQEQQWARNRVPLERLYSGNEGPEFKVPKF